MMTTAQAHPRLVACGGQCAAAVRHPGHHDRLLAVDTDPDALLELFEIAVTWHELDYSGEDVIGPADWPSFADDHVWRHPGRAERAFSLAVDIVGRPVGPAPDPALAPVIPLVH